MTTTPLAERLSLVLFGLRNAGKSSFFNRLMARDVSIVSPVAGTTTDPVTRPMELGSLGPIALTDTAGIDDDGGDLGVQRVAKSLDRLGLADVPILVSRADMPLDPAEREYLKGPLAKKATFSLILTHGSNPLHEEKAELLARIGGHVVDSLTGLGFDKVANYLMGRGAHASKEISPLHGLVQAGDFIVLVTPVDLAAPQGRLILPQVQTIRDSLDQDCGCLVVKERELSQFWKIFSIRPRLVICDSQAFSKVAADIPSDQALTSFSILFARKKGDLALYIQGLKALQTLPKEPRVLILESCAHHQQADDIGTVKIPRLFRQLVNPRATFASARELPSPEELSQVDMAISCGSCMVSRNSVMSRLHELRTHGIPVVNYGLFLAWVHGLMPRALQPIPEARYLWDQ